MTQYGRDRISNIICYAIPLTKITNIEGYQKHTHTQLRPNRPLWRRVDRVCAVKCIKFGHEMPAAINTHTEPTWHNIGSRAFEGYQKHTHTTLTEPTIVAQSGSRLIGQVHKVWPQHAWRNEHTPNRHGTRWDLAPLRVTKNTHTHTTLTEPNIVAESGSRLLGQVHIVCQRDAWRNELTQR